MNNIFISVRIMFVLAKLAIIISSVEKQEV